MPKPRGANIMAIRIRRGEKRAALAERCDVSYQYVWGIERGAAAYSNPSIEVLNRIANALEVPLSEVMESPERNDEDEPSSTREPHPTTHPEPNRPVAPPTPRRPNAVASPEVGAA
jgi:transcriptional regulator with XRE-family HTH domain